MNIVIEQDSKDYKSKSSSIGFSVKYDPGTAKADIKGSASKGNIDSKYDSVTTQSGIYAGNEGFDIHVEKNTDLKGAVIDSNAPEEKNKLTTGTLTWEDLQNKAEYGMSEKGILYNRYGNYDEMSQEQKNKVYKDKGLTPVLPTGASGKAESETKSAVAKGKIEIKDKDKQKQDIEKLNRDPANSLNKLGEIFSKKTIQEKQELAGLFGEMAYKQIHYMKGTKEEKAIYHALVGGIMSELSHGDFLSGASGAMVNKLIIDKIKEASHGDPVMMQWLSAAVGAAVSKTLTGNGIAGGSAAASGTKNNYGVEDEQAAIQYVLGDKTIFVEIQKNQLENLGYIDGPLDAEQEALKHKFALTIIKKLIDHKLIPNPKTMNSDYMFVNLGGGVGKNLSASYGYIISKKEDVYVFLQGSVGLGIGPVVFFEYGGGFVDPEWFNENGANGDDEGHLLNAAIEGVSVSGGASAIVGANMGKGVSDKGFGATTTEISKTMFLGKSISGRYAELIGNLKNDI